MLQHLTSKARGPLRALLIGSALGGAVVAAAAPAWAFDGPCCCDDGRYDSVGFGAAGSSGGFGFGGLGAGLGRIGAGLGGGIVGGALGGYGASGYGAPASYGYGRPAPLGRAD